MAGELFVGTRRLEGTFDQLTFSFCFHSLCNHTKINITYFYKRALLETDD